MARIIMDQRNTWGVSGKESPNAQRSDLWLVNMQSVVKGLNAQIQGSGDIGINILDDIPTYFAQTVDIPELKTNAEKYYRDSRPFMMPAYDEPLGNIKIIFYMDSPLQKVSKIYRLLDTWRAYVRAGRGAMSQEFAINLNENFRIDYAFPVSVLLLRGADTLNIIGAESFADSGVNSSSIATNFPELTTLPVERRAARLAEILRDRSSQPQGVENDLVVCGEYALDKVWLSSFKMTQLDYKTGNVITMLEANMFAENFRDINTSP